MKESRKRTFDKMDVKSNGGIVITSCNLETQLASSLPAVRRNIASD